MPKWVYNINIRELAKLRKSLANLSPLIEIKRKFVKIVLEHLGLFLFAQFPFYHLLSPYYRYKFVDERVVIRATLLNYITIF